MVTSPFSSHRPLAPHGFVGRVLGDASIEHGGVILREDRMGVFTHRGRPLETISRGTRNTR